MNTVRWICACEKLLLFCLFSALALSTLNASAFPTVPRANLPQGAFHQRTLDRTEIYKRLEHVLQARLTAEDMQVVDGVYQQSDDYQARVQNAGFLGSSLDVRFMVCVQARISLPNVAGFGGEAQPCVELGSGKSYMMFGVHKAPGGNASLNLLGAVYIGPESIAQAVVGQYGFYNGSMKLHPLMNIQGQFSISEKCFGKSGEVLKDLVAKFGMNLTSQGCQIILFAGAGVDLMGAAMAGLKKLKKTLGDGQVLNGPESKGKVEHTVGFIFKIEEHPWWDRMYRQHMNPVDAFMLPVN